MNAADRKICFPMAVRHREIIREQWWIIRIQWVCMVLLALALCAGCGDYNLDELDHPGRYQTPGYCEDRCYGYSDQQTTVWCQETCNSETKRALRSDSGSQGT